SQIHAVLVGGGAGVATDYNDQANICHAYHVLINHGVLPENIVLMIYDDVAYAPENPFPGKLFNQPNGTDVYAGCIKDYTGNDVNPETFMKVLKGDKELAKKGKKVLTSGPDDHVFIYFSDHGSVGAIYFQQTALTSQDLNETLTYMHQNNMYGKLTFYLEACESGSMFENILSRNINIYAITSANPGEPGYATYCDVPGFPFCLSDEFSAAWMPDTEHHDITKETLETQYEHVVKKVASSHPQQYGDTSLANLVISQFQGTSKSQNLPKEQMNSFGRVNQRDEALHYWRRRLESASENEYNEVRLKLSSIIAGRRFYDMAIRRVIGQLCSAGYCKSVNSVLNTRSSLFNHKAYSLLVKQFESSCINLGVNTYGLQYMYAFANIIESKGHLKEDELQLMMKTLEEACSRFIVNQAFDAIV
uniref:legumain n=1 Tax=Tetranychus urticae TaxID=32264 RepID=T1L4T4_TETUR